jgi:hypothetical protein
MRDPNKKTKIGLPLAVSATIDESSLLIDLVEKLANRRSDLGYCNQTAPTGWKAIETSSLEAYVSGNLDILNDDKHLALAYTTCFHFTCMKEKNGEYLLSWVSSLS